MAGRASGATLQRDFRAIFEFGVARDVSDRELLDRFSSADADSAVAETAFRFLVDRHGPMILRVCRQVLDDPCDVEDAFQATILVLLRRASSIRKRDCLASWLFGVATHVAHRARAAAAARRVHERHAGELAASRREAQRDSHAEPLAALHEEIARLPARYREPVVLCHLQGLSTLAAARRLGCAHGTVLSRLSRARGRLRSSLERRGRVEFAGFLTPGWLTLETVPPLPPRLLKWIVQAAAHAASVRAVSGLVVRPSVVALAESVLRTLSMTRMIQAPGLVAAAGVFTATMASSIPFWPSDGSSSLAAATSTQNAAEKLATDEPKGLRPQEIKDALYKILRRDHSLRDPRWPFLITVRGVDEDILLDATFRHRTKEDNREFDVVIQAKRAVLHADLTGEAVYAVLEEPELQVISPSGRGEMREILVLDQILKIPVPPGYPSIALKPKPATAAPQSPQQPALAAECLRRVKDIHGAENVWAVAGYRIGARALKELALPRHADSLLVVHQFPNEAYALMADGLQAATGVSAGKRSLRLETTVQSSIRTVIEDTKTRRRLVFSLNVKFKKSFYGTPEEFLVTEAPRVAALPDDAIFEVVID